ncbi:spore gernimation protein KA [Paenibacillus beijingensis]|uniref:Spore gernimation protein KA n=1 Tax=Paenibacillus beijingensis TaxID=1126833 RepID=A0A0D5NSJ8_9BACL|nr:spore gernimation protein KA [Paenibacillus beijingensis]
MKQGGRQGKAAARRGGKSSAATPLSRSLAANAHAIRTLLGESSDVQLRLFRSGASPDTEMAIIYIEAIVSSSDLNEMVIEKVMGAPAADPPLPLPELLEWLGSRVVSASVISMESTLEGTLERLLSGSCILLAEGVPQVLAAAIGGGDERPVGEPSTQTVIRGPQNSFNENLMTNVGLIRKMIRSERLRLEIRRIGRQTNTAVGMMYMDGIANESIVEELRRRLETIDLDSVLDSGYVEEFIQDATFTPFPTLMNTERPDEVAGGLLEGQVVVLVDGSPFVLLAPVTFFRFFQSPEDYYQRFDIATFLRLIRIVAFIVSMHLPALYIAITTYHQEMLPTTLLISLAAQREGVPFPAIVEAFLMELTFEVLREAGVRLPRAVGPAISIVGALVLGQAAVQAGLVSAAMVIVVAFTAISNFVSPQVNIAIAARLIRFLLMLAAGIFGFLGIMACDLLLIVHLSGLRSFGVPYTSPFSPFKWTSWKDTFVRAPWWLMGRRPAGGDTGDSMRQTDTSQPPHQQE